MSEGELKELISKIDYELQLENVPVAARELKVIQRVSERTGLSIGVTDDDLIFKTITDWYHNVYGEKCLVDFSIGTGVVIINSEPYAIKFPMVIGRREFNPLRLIEGATPALLSSIPMDLLKPFTATIMTQYYNFTAIQSLPPLCIADLSTSVSKIMDNQPSYNLSKWASQQSLEKTLKHYLKQKKQKYQYEHILENLHKKCVQCKMPPLDEHIIPQVDCKPAIRYEGEYTLEDAVISFNHSLFGVAHVARTLCNLPQPRFEIQMASSR